MITEQQEKEVRRILMTGRHDVYEKLGLVAEIFGITYDSQNNAVDMSKMGSNPVRESEEKLRSAIVEAPLRDPPFKTYIRR